MSKLIFFSAITLAFTTPSDDFHKDLSIQTLGNFTTEEYCKKAHVAVGNALELVGLNELNNMRVTHNGVCVPVDPEGSVSMLVEAVVSYPGIHLQVYNTEVVGPFTDEITCEEQMPLVAKLVPAYIDKYVDLRASCYQFK